jgi:glutamate synthase domain-containing protein 2
LEFANSVGMPARDAWIFVHNVLLGVSIRDRIKIVAAGKILTGFHMVRALALGADICVSARGMMLALGCIQALRCNTNQCPTGVATQNPALIAGLHAPSKAERVRSFHARTLESLQDLLGAMGLRHPDELRPRDIFRRVDDLKVQHLGELYEFMEPGQLLQADGVPDELREDWGAADPDRWTAA